MDPHSAASSSSSDPLLSQSRRSSRLPSSEFDVEQPEQNPNPNPNPQPQPQPQPQNPNPNLQSDQQRSSTDGAQTAPTTTFLGTSKPSSNYSGHIVALIFLVYLLVAVLTFCLNHEGYTGNEKSSHRLVDALYFSVVTFCTVGYGDIVPKTALTKFLSCLSVVVGFVIADALLTDTVDCVLDILARARCWPSARPMRIRFKVGLAIGVVSLFIGAGATALHSFEELNWGDAFYLSIISVTTVGYGDKAFSSSHGRVFASFWLLLSTLAFAKAVLYLTEVRINRRHRKIAKWVLHRDFTVEDMHVADIDHHGFISKSEFVIYKLKEMGKIKEKDILEIDKQFKKLDPHNTGELTLQYLLNTSNR